jgi:hypothetical protein
MAYRVLGSFHARLMASVGIDESLRSLPYVWRHCRAITIEEAAWLAAGEKFNLILFSYTFSTEDCEEEPLTCKRVVDVARCLTRSGVLCFLTPDIPVKKSLVAAVGDELEDLGLVRQAIQITRGAYAATAKRPTPVADLRREFNEECRRLEIPDVYGEDPKYDDPYYGFYCQLDVFTRP